METFIAQLTAQLLQTHGQNLERLCVVFPSRRATVFFKEHLVQSLDRPVFSPAVYAIEDFVRELNPVTLLDATSIAFELFPIYRELFPDEPFDRFFAWAPMLISDFDEIDRSLVDADAIYRNLFDLKEIDSTIGAWLNADGQPTEFQARYLRFWEQMATLYKRLRTKLEASNLAMPGQAVRAVAESFRDAPPRLPWAQVVFAGFNALSPAEELLIQSLVKHGLAETYWDLDRWYTEDPVQESGKFFRDMRPRWERAGTVPPGGWNWIGDRLGDGPRKITVTGVPRRVGQAKVAGLKLEEMLADGIAPERVAVVLPDENLLFPLLHSLPPALKAINVTMGFPLRHTPLFSLVEAIVQLHENAERLRPGQSEPAFHFRDVRNILRHPYIQGIAFQDTRELLKAMDRDNLVYLSPQAIAQHAEGPFLPYLFQPWTDVAGVIAYFIGLYQQLKLSLEKSDGGLPTLEAEYLFQFYVLTQKLRDKLEHYSLTVDQRMFRRLYRDLIQNGSIPFAGEPLQGLQIMGMLETRVLDFERIIVLSVNENVLPAKPRNASFIPYNLRVAFGLPLQEDKDAIYAYHFFRLLQRAHDVVLIHDTEHDSFGSGERSRFIAQIEMELARRNPAVTLNQETITFPTRKEPVQPIVVAKDAVVLDRLREIGSDKGYSPSAISTYLNCPLKFYYRYILRLKEREELEHSMAANTFGKVVHQVLEVLYTPFKGQEVQAADIQAMQAQIEPVAEQAFLEVTKANNRAHGKNYLLLRVIHDLVAKLLQIDEANAPFEIIELEHKTEAMLVTERNPLGVKVAGVIDRIDRHKGQVRIVDYKTGRADDLKLSDFEEIRDGDKKREAFQLATYAWLYLKAHPTESALAGIYQMRNLSQGLSLLSTGPTLSPVQDLRALLPFEDLLSGILDELFDLDVPFVQTEEEKRCEYCPYKVMCVRT